MIGCDVEEHEPKWQTRREGAELGSIGMDEVRGDGCCGMQCSLGTAVGGGRIVYNIGVGTTCSQGREILSSRCCDSRTARMRCIICVVVHTYWDCKPLLGERRFRRKCRCKCRLRRRWRWGLTGTEWKRTWRWWWRRMWPLWCRLRWRLWQCMWKIVVMAIALVM